MSSLYASHQGAWVLHVGDLFGKNYWTGIVLGGVKLSSVFLWPHEDVCTSKNLAGNAVWVWPLQRSDSAKDIH